MRDAMRDGIRHSSFVLSFFRSFVYVVYRLFRFPSGFHFRSFGISSSPVPPNAHFQSPGTRRKTIPPCCGLSRRRRSPNAPRIGQPYNSRPRGSRSQAKISCHHEAATPVYPFNHLANQRPAYFGFRALARRSPNTHHHDPFAIPLPFPQILAADLPRPPGRDLSQPLPCRSRRRLGRQQRASNHCSPRNKQCSKRCRRRLAQPGVERRWHCRRLGL